MRIVVTGKEGQLARSLIERGTREGLLVVPVGRPEFDLEKPETVAPALTAAAPDVIINAAAYTAVDQAEIEADKACAINGRGAGAVAEAAAKLQVPIIHISTDYVFDGSSERPYCEDDPVHPLGAYGASKLLGEEMVAAASENCAILRTAWVYSPFGKNFVKTMLRLACDRDEISVVADQIGSPTSALSLADVVLTVASNMTMQRDNPALRGVFHVADAGEASWADFATAIFARSRAMGGPFALVNPIPTSAYPTPAVRPANSRLSPDLIERVHGAKLRHWREALASCVDRLVAAGFSKGQFQ
jgi:dTDP-4-dehydrorhamnose reductase